MSSVESLTDEILVEIFSHLNLFDLLTSFSKLNKRFCRIIFSLKNFDLTLSKDENDSLELIEGFHRKIVGLTTIGALEIRLENFDKIRRLILRSPSKNVIDQLERIVLPDLEILFIDETFLEISTVLERIFSNVFPRLKICSIFGFETIETIRPWTKSPSICQVELSSIDFYVFQQVLISCRNLKVFKLKIFQNYLKLIPSFRHENLRTLQIESDVEDGRSNDELVDAFLSVVPRVENLIVRRTFSRPKLDEFSSGSDFLASILSNRLKFLSYFQVDFRFDSNFDEFLSDETRMNLHEKFDEVHKNFYRTRFTIR